MPVHLGGSVPRAVERAARIGDGYFPPMPALWSRYRRACTDLGKPDPGPLPANGPIFTWVTREEPDAVWERLTPHILHQIRSYAEWTAAAYGEPMGPFVPTKVLDDVRQGGAYRVVTPEEAIDLAHGLGPDGRFNLSPLLAGIDPAWSWEMLRCVEHEVLPALG
jgi:alkanesulfonate monooxygenase SsuD/methylene tetrahydromethanopterin reductase-like flavin-dependent oxidoreductase (luciferase family)